MHFLQFILGLHLLGAGLTVAQVQAFELSFEAHSEQFFAQPHDITLSPDRRYLYIADNNNDRIAVLDPSSLALLGSFAQKSVSRMMSFFRRMVSYWLPTLAIVALQSMMFRVPQGDWSGRSGVISPAQKGWRFTRTADFM